jgi:hypothetical protein
MAQLGIEFRRSFAITSFALSEQFDPVLNFSGSRRSSFQLANERQQLSQLVLDQFVIEQRLLPAFILESFLVVFTIFPSASIHVASPLVIQS